MKDLELRVWWIPQIPMEAFHVSIPDWDTGQLLLNAFADYDIFQFETRIKPDYCNMGGIEFKHPHYTENEWHSLEEDEAVELGIATEAQEAA